MKLDRTTLIAAGAAGAAVIAIVAGVGVGLSGASTPVDTSSSPTTPKPRASSSSEPTEAATPTASATPEAGDAPAAPVVDPYYGDVVVSATDDDSAKLAAGVKVDLVSVAETSITGSGVGSTSGPGIEVTVRVTNTSAATITIAPVVNAYVGDERTPLTPDHDTPIASSIAASGQSVGSYTFAVDDSSATIWITVSTAPDSGLVLFEYSR